MLDMVQVDISHEDRNMRETSMGGQLESRHVIWVSYIKNLHSEN
jgi:hypothetical protein